MNLKRNRYQQGSFTTEKRKNGPSVYVYRWREKQTGGSVKRKQILGTIKELTKAQAQRKADELRQSANAPAPAVPLVVSLTVEELAAHYAQRELSESSGKAAKVRKHTATSSTTTFCQSGVTSHSQALRRFKARSG